MDKKTTENFYEETADELKDKLYSLLKYNNRNSIIFDENEKFTIETGIDSLIWTICGYEESKTSKNVMIELCFDYVKAKNEYEAAKVLEKMSVLAEI
jgi:hypothetical protein